MVVAVLVAASRGRSRVGLRTALLLRAAGFGAIAFAFATRDVSAADALYFHTICGFGLALLVASSVLSDRHGSWARVLAARPLQLLGLVSYSLYLWHEPLMLQLAKHGLLVSQSPHAFPANALVLVGLSLVVAYASYWLIEYPTLQLRHLFTRDGRWSDYYGAQQQTPALSATST